MTPPATRRQRRRGRALWGLLALWMIAASAGASTPVDEPSFRIEKLTVEGNRRATAEIILSESLLQPGRVYFEDQLREAERRIQRLPFILEASFSLRKGSERGLFELVITVEETRRYFFGEDLVFTRFTNSVAFDSLFGEDFTVSPGGLAGIRFFVGKYGVLFGSVSGNSSVQAGYTQYNLFDRRIFFSLGLTSSGCCPVRVLPLGLDPTFSSWQNEADYREVQLTLGVPLGLERSLRLQVSQSHSEEGERQNLLGLDRLRGSLDYQDLEQTQVELAWLHDTTDDPLFPSRGMSVTAALDYQRVAADLRVPEEPGSFLFPKPPIFVPDGLDPILPQMVSEQLRLSATVAQHWQLSSRQFVSLSARLAVGRAEVSNLPVLDDLACTGVPDCAEPALRLIGSEDLDLLEGYFTARYSLSLWGTKMVRERGDFRWENTLEFGYDQASPSLDLRDNPLYRKSFTTSLVFRNAWGVFRFSFQIADFGQEL